MPTDGQPTVAVVPAVGQVRAVALVLPGGRADSFEPMTGRQLAGVRMRPFARVLSRQGRRMGLEVQTLRYRFRGWNGSEMSPVADARWALEQIRSRHGAVPVVLVGHSMGGRTALRVADDTSVRAVVALAPWVLDADPVEQLAGKGVLVVHGSLDRVTSPAASRRYADRARQVAERVDYVTIRGETHAMVLRPWRWHALAARFALGLLAG